MPAPELVIRETSDHLFAEAAHRLIAAADEDAAARGAFHLAMSGGSTPEGLYRLLAGPPWEGKIPWDRLHVWFGDERCVPPGDPASNYRMAREAWLDQTPLPEDRVHRMPGEAPPEEGAQSYAQELAQHLPLAPDGTPVFDLVLLGLGSDGHVASLFPGTEALQASSPVAANYVPALQVWRLTITLPVINAARRVWLLVTGPEKAAIIARARQGGSEQSLPVRCLEPGGQWLWLLDRKAAGHLDE